jgi:hypothetical protein
MLILFLHGWQSTPGGVKPTYLRSHGHAVLNPALPDDDFAAAVRIAQAEMLRSLGPPYMNNPGWCWRSVQASSAGNIRKTCDGQKY